MAVWWETYPPRHAYRFLCLTFEDGKEYMNRIASTLLLAMSASVFASGAQAQQAASGAGGTGVTLYGVLDGYLQLARSNTNLNRMQSGGLSGSRIGFRGTEDLGGGLRGFFILEGGVNIDDGSSAQGGTLFGRQSVLGLQGAFGQVSLGRQYSSVYTAANDFSVFGNNPYGASTGLIGGFAGGYEPTRGASSTAQAPATGATGNGSPTRVNNSIKYETPALGGFRIGALYGFGETSSESSNSNDQRLVDAYLRWNAGAFDAILSYIDDKTLPTPEGLEGTNVKVGSLAAGMNLGPVRMVAGYMDVNDKRIDNQDGKGYWVGGEYRFSGSNLVRLQYVENNPEGDDDKSRALGLGYQYDFSRRTAFYSAVTRFRNETNAGSNGLGRWHSSLPTGLTVAGDSDITEFVAGVRHSF
jgi:predicted porin